MIKPGVVDWGSMGWQSQTCRVWHMEVGPESSGPGSGVSNPGLVRDRKGWFHGVSGNVMVMVEG